MDTIIAHFDFGRYFKFSLLSVSCFALFQSSISAADHLPALTLLKTSSGRTYVGEVLQKSSENILLFDLTLKDSITLKSSEIDSTIDDLSETSIINSVGYPTFAAWKVSRMMNTGKIQGRLTLSSDKRTFVTLGSGDGISKDQTMIILGPGESITDPETGEKLGTIHQNLGTLTVKEVKNRRFSEVTANLVDPALVLESGMVVECNRESKAVVIQEPEWKSDNPDLKTGNEAVLLTEHILTELVEFGVPVITQEAVQNKTKEIAKIKGITPDSVSYTEAAKKLNAGILLKGYILPRNIRHAEVSLRVNDVDGDKYRGIITGRIRRDQVEQNLKSAQQIMKAKQNAFKTKTSLLNSIGVPLKRIEPGTFIMGDYKNQEHQVQISKPFYIGVFEVTQAQFARVMGFNPSAIKNPNHPVEQVSWNDALEFCNRLSGLPAEHAAGRVYRLPTEAEWEYACRAGTNTTYSFGNSDEQLKDYAWYIANAKHVQPVGLKRPNPWKLFDMHGNVFEWCQDWSDSYPDQPAVDPTGPTEGEIRVFRGGGRAGIARTCHSAYRGGQKPDFKQVYVGFRVAMQFREGSE